MSDRCVCGMDIVTKNRLTSPWLARGGKIFAVAAVYFLLGWMVFSANLSAASGAVLWPSAGLALAALLRFGNQVWPGVFLGSFGLNCWLAWQGHQANSTDSIAVSVAAGHAIGATLQALFGAMLVRRFIVLPNNFDRELDIAKFLVIAGPVACLVDASWSVTLQWLIGATKSVDYVSHWIAWWLKDVAGSLMTVPVLLVYLGPGRAIQWRRVVSVGAPVITLGVLLCWVFINARDGKKAQSQIEFGRQATSVADALQKTFDNQMTLLHTMAGFYASSAAVSHKEFTSFVRTIMKGDQAMQALEWVPRVSSSQRAEFEKFARQDGLPEFELTERNSQSQLVRAGARGALSGPLRRAL